MLKVQQGCHSWAASDLCRIEARKKCMISALMATVYVCVNEVRDLTHPC